MHTNDISQSCSNEVSNDYPHIVLNNFLVGFKFISSVKGGFIGPFLLMK